jgi:electron transport complex protein RnfD
MTADLDDELTIDGSAAGGTPEVPPAGALLTVSFPPHARSPETVRRIMLVTCAALLPAFCFSVVIYGIPALVSVLAAVAAAAAAEWIIVAVRDGSTRPVLDGSSCLTGLLLALSLPPSLPVWAAPLASVFAVGVVKMVFGGLGRNFLNPALAGRAFCAFTFPALFIAAGSASRPGETGSFDTVANLFVGYAGGWLGASSTAALLAGAVALWILRIIDFSVPLSFLGGAFLLSWATCGRSLLFTAAGPMAALAFIFTGGIPLVALFMATDPVTSPATRRSRLLFGTGCGALTFVFRTFGNANDGAMYAVLLMNLTVPWFDRSFRQVPFGGRRRIGAHPEGEEPSGRLTVREVVEQTEFREIPVPVEER